MSATACGRLPIVTVLGSGTSEHPNKAAPLGSWLAQQDVHLLTGGGGGVMTSVSRAFSETLPRSGSVVGVLPGDPESGEPPTGYPNPWVEIPIATHLPLSGERGMHAMSRNHINVLSGDVLIALPGGAGTASEIRLAVDYGRRVAVYVDSQEELPVVHPRIQLCETLDAVQSFVLDCLSGGGDS